MSKIPEKFTSTEIEAKWEKQWEESKVYRWDPNVPRENTFVVDTPPPTASGSLHVGHVFSYTQTDVIVRQQRMLGKNIFYPMGWDDNGLPTERRVQNYFGIRCDPRLHYDAAWKPRANKGEKEPVEQVSRQNFIEACSEVTSMDEKAYERLFRRLALSLDWSLQYATIDKHCRRVSQFAFLELVKKKLAYQSLSPTMWDVDFRSAIAQAELEDRVIAGAFHDIRFGVEGGDEFVISTTRPELLAACIAVVAHPSDERYKKYFGKTAIVPLYHAPVPILPAEHADPEKGTGILMVCTFGDIMDVEWWKTSKLPAKQVLGLDGRFLELDYGTNSFKSVNPEAARANYAQIAKLTVKQAQKKTVELLKAPGSSVDGKTTALVGEPKPITHPVKFYEKGERPLEFVPTRQWFINILDHKESLLEQGRKVKWHPSHMLTRYENWVQGLNQDWCISRQRYFGVPFPVWYPVKKDGSTDFDSPIYADTVSLPVDPLAEAPKGFKEDQRDKPGGFTGDPDVMDTWATSSLTPQIQSFWGADEKRHKTLFPMDIRPQGHDIIRTWAFSTIVQAWHHEKTIPWHHAVISGWILDPDRKKMSKSKGNTVTPQHLLDEYSSDAVRYWASRARLGADTAFDEKLFTIGRKLVTKIFNASRFVLMQIERVGISPSSLTLKDINQPLDIALVEKLRTVIQEATDAFSRFDYATALQHAEDTFWGFCDHYLELVKARSYSDTDSPERRSALSALNWALQTFLRLFAPTLPYITEEVWSWCYSSPGAAASVHTANWPSVDETKGISRTANPRTFDAAVELIGKIRGAKTDAQKSLKWGVSALKVTGPKEIIEAVTPALPDILRAGNVSDGALTIAEGASPEGSLFTVEVHLSSEPPAERA